MIKLISESTVQTPLDINALTEKTTPVNADITVLEDSADTFAKKKLSFTNLKAFLKTYFDTLYTGGTFDIHALTDKPTPVNADETVITDSATSFTNKKLTLTNLKAFLKTYFDTLYPAETTTTEGALINSATSKTTPVDADYIGLMDSAASNVLKKLSWANLKATAKTYFDTLYVALTSKDATGGYAGLTLFKINFKNAADTFTSFFTNTNTAARTYTFQDRDGTVMDGTNHATGSVDNAILRADGTGGVTSQSSGVTIDDNGKVETAGSFKVTTSTAFVSSDGAKFYRQSAYGTCIQGVTGSVADVCFFTPSGVRLMENPTGTTNLVTGVAGTANYYLGYSTMTANNPTFYVYGWDTGSSSAKFGQFKTLSTGSFQILAQSGENLELGSNGATIIHVLSAGGVGIGGSPNANAILDCQSTTKAFMPPRMTTTQRDAIASPTAGMVIFNSTTAKLNVYTTAWEAVTSA